MCPLTLCSWYQDRNLDVSTIPPTAANENTTMHNDFSCVVAAETPSNPCLITTAPSNPFQLQPKASTTPGSTQTIEARTVFHEAQAAIRPLIAGIQTQEQLDGLLDSLQEIQLVTFLTCKGRPLMDLSGLLKPMKRSARQSMTHQR